MSDQINIHTKNKSIIFSICQTPLNGVPLVLFYDHLNQNYFYCQARIADKNHATFVNHEIYGARNPEDHNSVDLYIDPIKIYYLSAAEFEKYQTKNPVYYIRDLADSSGVIIFNYLLEMLQKPDPIWALIQVYYHTLNQQYQSQIQYIHPQLLEATFEILNVAKQVDEQSTCCQIQNQATNFFEHQKIYQQILMILQNEWNHYYYETEI
ncbi:hypothetical protein J2Z62_000430 [Mycoplasmoides fastidiosum]|uniref:Uncharacterized protein n=1 Tax=Mycoplasmoides fastidiosum TaxID=92758 RepID=A0ABU0LZ83_9BACT|nr:hypothetical protein [Mycoplasmoides fastidiosum]MDQ0513992.1 hypothetical protein [Mycoplasmoides fastidiosum]UUD37594.1 hypothetical protein NPA10_03440 [Mycoplasmoides fastidiosum]